MNKLIYHYLLVNKRLLLINAMLLIIYTAWMTSQDMSPRLYFSLCGFMVIFVLPLVPLLHEDQHKTSALLCSLSHKRQTIVLSKYVFSWLVAPLGALLTIALSILLPFSKIAWAQLLAPGTLFLGLFIMGFSLAALIPFIFRFGRYGVFLALVGLQVLGVVFFIMAALFGIRIRLGILFKWIGQAAAFLQRHWGVPGYFFFILTLIVLLNLASLRISQHLFQGKDL